MQSRVKNNCIQKLVYPVFASWLSSQGDDFESLCGAVTKTCVFGVKIELDGDAFRRIMLMS